MAKSKKRNLTHDELPDWLDTELWDDFVKFRSEIGKQIWETGEKRMIKRLDKIRDGDNYVDILERSMRNNWMDVYPLANDFNKKPEQPTTNNHKIFNPAEHL